MGIGGDRSRWVPRGGWFRRPIPRLLIVKRDVADAPEGAVSVEVIDSSGMVIRSVQTPWLNVVESWRVAFSSACKGYSGRMAACGQRRGRANRWRCWTGDPSWLPSGVEDFNGRLTLRDVVDGREAVCEPPGDLFFRSPVFDQMASAVSMPQSNTPRMIVASASTGLRVVDVGFEQQSAAWVDSRRLLLVGERPRVVLDVHSGEQSTVDGLAKDAHPRIDVSGRFDIKLLKAAHAPRADGSGEQERGAGSGAIDEPSASEASDRADHEDGAEDGAECGC
jgi:hypothetical protein